MERKTKLFEILKDRYNFEHDRKNGLLEQHSNLIQIFTLVFGIGFYIYQNRTLDNYYISFLVMTFFIVSVIMFLVGIFFLMTFALGKKYAYLPLPSEINKDFQSIEEYSEDDIKKNQLTLDFLIHYYGESSQINIISNDKKSMYLINAKLFLVYSVIFVLISGILIFLF